MLMLWILLFGFGAGIAVTVRGWQGTAIGDQPWCRRCRYHLHIDWEESKVCTECGGDLSDPSAVRIGHRRKRTGLMAAGAAGMLIALAWGTFLVRQRTDGFQNWYPIQPTWLLTIGARGNDALALGELTSRYRDDRLSESRIRQLVVLGLDAQLDTTINWHKFSRWGSLIESARDRGLVTDEQWKRYVRQGVIVSLEAPGSVRAGSMAGDFKLTVGMSRVALFQRFVAVALVSNRTIGGFVIDAADYRIVTGLSSSSSSGMIYEHLVPILPDGEIRICADVSVKVYETGPVHPSRGQRIEDVVDLNESLVEFNLVVETTTEIVN